MGDLCRAFNADEFGEDELAGFDGAEGDSDLDLDETLARGHDDMADEHDEFGDSSVVGKRALDIVDEVFASPSVPKHGAILKAASKVVSAKLEKYPQLGYACGPDELIEDEVYRAACGVSDVSDDPPLAVAVAVAPVGPVGAKAACHRRRRRHHRTWDS